MTDEQIRAMRDLNVRLTGGDTYLAVPHQIAELCNEVLASRARIKVLEEALRPFTEATLVVDRAWVRARIRKARKALDAK